ncbi:viral A-type inclusion protein [Reticulomyxa filosa]|uniref:Viral A-type inclusion protein n=1 Tax=Reticulomyxa filosa TaxID=46433 RepID=X6PC83_RETFI|nr:viral A-type inclusion protein [Reticulomyxa filosa]|eukprot:ETO35713.1 viral A-type inclusion protein [Reticulomyxa filosa]
MCESEFSENLSPIACLGLKALKKKNSTCVYKKDENSEISVSDISSSGAEDENASDPPDDGKKNLDPLIQPPADGNNTQHDRQSDREAFSNSLLTSAEDLQSPINIDTRAQENPTATEWIDSKTLRSAFEGAIQKNDDKEEHAYITTTPNTNMNEKENKNEKESEKVDVILEKFQDLFQQTVGKAIETTTTKKRALPSVDAFMCIIPTSGCFDLNLKASAMQVYKRTCQTTAIFSQVNFNEKINCFFFFFFFFFCKLVVLTIRKSENLESLHNPSFQRAASQMISPNPQKNAKKTVSKTDELVDACDSNMHKQESACKSSHSIKARPPSNVWNRLYTIQAQKIPAKSSSNKKLSAQEIQQLSNRLYSTHISLQQSRQKKKMQFLENEERLRNKCKMQKKSILIIQSNLRGSLEQALGVKTASEQTDKIHNMQTVCSALKNLQVVSDSRSDPFLRKLSDIFFSEKNTDSNDVIWKEEDQIPAEKLKEFIDDIVYFEQIYYCFSKQKILENAEKHSANMKLFKRKKDFVWLLEWMQRLSIASITKNSGGNTSGQPTVAIDVDSRNKSLIANETHTDNGPNKKKQASEKQFIDRLFNIPTKKKEERLNEWQEAKARQEQEKLQQELNECTFHPQIKSRNRKWFESEPSLGNSKQNLESSTNVFFDHVRNRSESSGSPNGLKPDMQIVKPSKTKPRWKKLYEDAQRRMEVHHTTSTDSCKEITKDIINNRNDRNYKNLDIFFFWSNMTPLLFNFAKGPVHIKKGFICTVIEAKTFITFYLLIQKKKLSQTLNFFYFYLRIF